MSGPAVRDTARPLVRSYGDTAREYQAARANAVVIDRADRALIRVTGRDPVRMVNGLVSNDVQNLPVDDAVYATLLTPKGRMVADLRVIRRTDQLLLELDGAALPGVLAHLKKFVPPLFARPADVSAELAVLGIYGPDAASPVAAVLGVQNAAALAEDRMLTAVFADQPVALLRTGYAGVPGFDIVLPLPLLGRLQEALAGAGATPAGHAVLDVLRIEAGQPRWGAELGEDVIPLEAGLAGRAISTSKGCYTGQEVIIRILHRGHVNRHLRGLLLGDAPTPAAGEELFREGQPKSLGKVTSACFSPAHAQTIALAYVRREVEPGEPLRLGSPGGPPARVVALPFPPAATRAAEG